MTGIITCVSARIQRNTLWRYSDGDDDSSVDREGEGENIKNILQGQRISFENTSNVARVSGKIEWVWTGGGLKSRDNKKSHLVSSHLPGVGSECTQ